MSDCNECIYSRENPEKDKYECEIYLKRRKNCPSFFAKDRGLLTKNDTTKKKSNWNISFEN